MKQQIEEEAKASGRANGKAGRKATSSALGDSSPNSKKEEEERRQHAQWMKRQMLVGSAPSLDGAGAGGIKREMSSGSPSTSASSSTSPSTISTSSLHAEIEPAASPAVVRELKLSKSAAGYAVASDEAVAELRREVERLRSRVATQEAQLKQGDRVLQMRDAKVSALEGRVQELSAATRPTTSSEEEAVATSARERCETLTKELEVKDRLIKALQADRKEKKELQDRCEAMSKELEEKEARLKALQADRKEKKELQARCETVSKELEEKETRIKTLQVHVAHVDRPRSL